MKFAVLTLLAISVYIPTGFANSITFPPQSPQRIPAILSDLEAWAPQIESPILKIANEDEGECGDSNNDGICDDGGSQD